MSRRNYIDEILEKKQRLKPTSRRWALISDRINELSKIAELVELLDPQPEDRGEITEYEDVQWELARYIPIGFVACIEGYFRVVYANMIDRGPPFRENASHFDIKFNLSTALSLQKHSVSLGEFVAHLLPTNSLDDINRNISTLIDDDFLARFKEKRAHLDKQQRLFDITDEEISAHLLSRIKRLFELRHMYCHEADPPMSGNDLMWIEACPRYVVEFLWTSEELISELLA